MFYMLSYKRKDNVWVQVGIVAADSVQDAAKKIEIRIVEVSSQATAGIWAELENGYCLEGYEEITSPRDFQSK